MFLLLFYALDGIGNLVTGQLGVAIIDVSGRIYDLTDSHTRYVTEMCFGDCFNNAV